MKPIRIDVNPEKGYLVLETVFPSTDKTSFKELSVTVSLDYLVEYLLHMSPWHGSFACLVASDGTYRLTPTARRIGRKDWGKQVEHWRQRF